MSTAQALNDRWQAAASQILALGPMRPGSLCQQKVKYRTAEGADTLNGPYPILTAKENGKTRTLRLDSAEQTEVVRQQVDNFRQFQRLTHELVRIGRELAELELAEQRAGKKNSSNASRPRANAKRRRSWRA